MNKNIVFFLDFDGTINIMPEYISNRTAFKNGHYNEICFTESCIEYLNQLAAFCKRTLKQSSKIVVTSAWRTEANLQTFRSIFKNNDCIVPVLDKTPSFMYSDNNMPHDYMRNTRGREIERWLDNNNEKVDDFVIFDDSVSDIIELYSSHLVHVDSMKGINERSYEIAIEILTN